MNDAALARRRHLPGPPCVPWPEAAAPPGVPLAPAAFADDPWPPLAAVAAALDCLHGYRLAHGALDDHAVRLDGAAAWLAGVPPEAATNAAGTPRQRDLAYFADLCGRTLGVPAPTPGPTASATLATLRPEEPPPPADPARAEDAVVEISEAEPAAPDRAAEAVAADLPRAAPKERGTPQWMLAGSLFAVLAVAGAFYWHRRQEALRVEEPLLAPGRLVSTEGRAALERLPAALAKLDPDAYAFVKRQLELRDTTFSNAMLRNILNPELGAKARPGLLKLLEEPLPDFAKEQLLACLLQVAAPEDAPTLVKAIDRPGANAYEQLRLAAALRRLGKPLPDADLFERACRVAGTEQFELLRLMAAPTSPEVLALARARGMDSEGRPGRMWFVFLASLADERDRRRAPPERAARVALHRQSLGEWLARPAAEADAWAILTLESLWKFAPEAPERFWRGLGLAEPAAARLRRALPTRQPRGAQRWDGPDDLAAAMFAWAGAPPAALAGLANGTTPRRWPRGLEQQSRLLAFICLPEADRAAARAALQAAAPAGSAGVVGQRAALAALGAAEPLPADYDVAEWEGLAAGALLDPAANRAALAAARRHPLPTVWRRAADGLALLEGRRAALRAEPAPPTLAPALQAALDEFAPCAVASQAEGVLSRASDLGVARTALALSRADGAFEYLQSRARDSADANYRMLLASAPHHLGRRWVGELSRQRNFDQLDQAVLQHFALSGEASQLAALEDLAFDRGAGSSPPPLHQALAIRAWGALKLRANRTDAVAPLLAALDREAHLLVRHAAALEIARNAGPGDVPALAKFLAERPDLPAALVPVLKLAMQP